MGDSVQNEGGLSREIHWIPNYCTSPSSLQRCIMAEQSRPNPIPVFVVQGLLSIVILGGIYYGGYHLCDIQVPASMDATSRFAYTLRWTLPMVLVLIVAIEVTMISRGTTGAVNPLSGKEHLVQIYKNFVTNTLEQLMVSLLLMLIATTYCDTPDMIKIVPICAITFTVGRILFFIGYKITPMYRATGMTVNFFSSILMAGYIIYLTYTKGMLYGLGTVYPSIQSPRGGGVGQTEL